MRCSVPHLGAEVVAVGKATWRVERWESPNDGLWLWLLSRP